MKKLSAKKKTAIALIILALLFIPIPGEIYKDGGTREYSCAAYKIVKWNRLAGSDDQEIFGDDMVYHRISVYWFPQNWKRIDELWEIEKKRISDERGYCVKQK